MKKGAAYNPDPSEIEDLPAFLRRDNGAPPPADAPPSSIWSDVLGIPEAVAAPEQRQEPKPIAIDATPPTLKVKNLGPSHQVVAPLVDGVCRRGNRWQAATIQEGRLVHLGMFRTEEEANRVWRQASSPNESSPEPFTPSDEQRRLVRDLATWGLPQNQIRFHIINPVTGRAVGDKTFSHYFMDEITAGLLAGDSDTVRMLHTQMVGRDPVFMTDPETGDFKYDEKGRPILLRKELQPNVAAAIFKSKVRPGVALRETMIVEHTKSAANQLYDKLKDLPRERLYQLRELLREPASPGYDSDEEGAGSAPE